MSGSARARRRRRGGSARPRAAAPRRNERPVALTGTPGVGKTTVARLLRRRWTVVEVSALALRTGTGRRRGRAVEVDLPRLRAAARARSAVRGVDVIVGHLAHLLPVREAIVLRCHPSELARRLTRARRGRGRDRAANVVSEALDLVLGEALARREVVYEVDTTGRSARAVAREVDRRLRRGGRPRVGVVAWLTDRTVTEHLLEGTA